MKKIILLLLLISGLTNAQTKSFDEDLRVKFDSFKKMTVTTPEMKAIKLQAIESMYKYAENADFKTEIKNYLDEFKKDPLDVDDNKPFDIKKIPKEKLKNFRYQTDKFTGRTFFTHKKAGRIYIYIGKSSETTYLRFVCDYRGSSWVFMKNMVFLIDDKKYSYVPKDVKTDVTSSASVIERFDNTVDENTMELINAIANAKSSIDVRFIGNDKSNDTSFLNKVHEHFQETIDLFNYLKNVE